MVTKEIAAYTNTSCSVPGVASPVYNDTKVSVINEPPKLWWCKELEQLGYNRGFCRKYRVGGIKSRNDNVYALCYLVYDRNNNYVGYTKRLLDTYREFILKKTGQIPSKWLHSKGLHTRNVLYGERWLDQNYDKVIICEGAKDVAHLLRLGFKNVVASFGLGLKCGQEGALIEMGFSNIIFLYDHDDAGLLYLESKNFKRISCLFNVKVATTLMLPQKDPDDLTRKELETILN
jgi:5S rRNA maturation endonuclease (ribonuclease M5)